MLRLPLPLLILLLERSLAAARLVLCSHPAGHSTVCHSLLWHGISHGMAQHGMAWQCAAWHGLCDSLHPKPAGLGDVYHSEVPSAWLPRVLPWGHSSSGSTRPCLGSDPHTPKTRGSPAAVPLAPLPSMPHVETHVPRPLGTALPSPTKQVLSFIFGWHQGCKRSSAGAQPHCKPLQLHCRSLYCLLRAGCRQTPPSPCPQSHHRRDIGTMSVPG